MLVRIQELPLSAFVFIRGFSNSAFRLVAHSAPKAMKFSNPIRARLFRLSATLAILAWSQAGAFGAELNVTYNTGSDLPVSTDGYTAAGGAVNFTLNHAPATGAELMVVQNTGLGYIDGVFDNLAHGQTVTVNYSGDRKSVV